MMLLASQQSSVSLPMIIGFAVIFGLAVLFGTRKNQLEFRKFAMLLRMHKRKIPLSAREVTFPAFEGEQEKLCGQTYLHAIEHRLDRVSAGSFYVSVRRAAQEGKMPEGQLAERVTRMAEILSRVPELPAPVFEYTSKPMDQPDWIPFMAEAASQFLMKTELFDAAGQYDEVIRIIGLSSAVLDHLASWPGAGVCRRYFDGLAALHLEASSLVGNAVLSRRLSPINGLRAMESARAVRRPWHHFPAEFIRHLEVISEIPECEERLLELGFSQESVRLACQPDKLKERKQLATVQALTLYESLMAVPDPDSKTGEELVKACKSAQAAASKVSCTFTELYLLASPDPLKMTLMSLALESIRRVNVTSARILHALDEGASWQAAVGLDECVEDPYSGRRFDISVVDETLVIAGTCPNVFSKKKAGVPVSLTLDLAGFLHHK